MLDRWALQLVKKPLNTGAVILARHGVSADSVTVAGFAVGLLALPALFMKVYWVALVCILVNRLADGLDGEIARIQGPTDGGGFLDITLDFIFYSSVVLGFALADPVRNGLAATVLLFAFAGTGSSFLAFAIMAEKRGLTNLKYPHKGFFYLAGLAEGTETLIFFVLFCLFPGFFPELAYAFAVICLITVVTRVFGGYLALKNDDS
ncbi:CDP-alcohol phosphatidyltransferase family protein [Desulfomarina sp.]